MKSTFIKSVFAASSVAILMCNFVLPTTPAVAAKPAGAKSETKDAAKFAPAGMGFSVGLDLQEKGSKDISIGKLTVYGGQKDQGDFAVAVISNLVSKYQNLGGAAAQGVAQGNAESILPQLANIAPTWTTVSGCTAATYSASGVVDGTKTYVRVTSVVAPNALYVFVGMTTGSNSDVDSFFNSIKITGGGRRGPAVTKAVSFPKFVLDKSMAVTTKELTLDAKKM